MAVKHTLTGIIHSGNKGSKTGCGENTTEHASHWENTRQEITCEKNGCK